MDNDGEFDDGSGVTIIPASPTAGTFTVGLRVTDEDGSHDISNTIVTILPEQVIPKVPLETIAASAAMIIALVAYVIRPKWRRTQLHTIP